MRQLRELHGKTLAQVAQATGVSPATVSRYERGDTPPADYCERFYSAFFIEPGALLRLAEVVKP
jgi:transcriptional regulator with XRE-family HTH domain